MAKKNQPKKRQASWGSSSNMWRDPATVGGSGGGCAGAALVILSLVGGVVTAATFVLSNAVL